MKILAVIDAKPASLDALRTAGVIAGRLGAALAVTTVRAGTHATEAPPPVGVEIPVHHRTELPRGIQVLLEAAGVLSAEGLLAPVAAVTLRDAPHGHLFFARTPGGERVIFSERFGDLIDELNQEIAENGFDLVVAAAPRRGAFGRFVSANVPRRMALDLHASFLVVRGGAPDSRYVVCADGSPSSRRIFPLFQKLLPAVRGGVELVCVQKPAPEPKDVEQAEHCLQIAHSWLTRCGKDVRVSRLKGDKRFRLILEAAGSDAVIVMGESHMHDVRRRTLGSLPLKVLSRTDASFLMVKQPTAPDPEMFEETFTCE